jgi:hypothetical protein
MEVGYTKKIQIAIGKMQVLKHHPIVCGNYTEYLKKINK